jgi:integrase
MQQQLLTAGQTAGILGINENTLTALANTGRIPHIRVPGVYGDGPQFRFNAVDISAWLKQGPELASDNEAFITRFSRRIENQFPAALAGLRKYDRQFTAPRKPKGYSLSKVANKKIGFVYYVRYIEKGRLVPSRWSTHTNNIEAAERFAVDNRNRLLSAYGRRGAGVKASDGGMYTLLREYYAENSLYLKKDMQRGRTLREVSRVRYHNTVLHQWIPFLKKHRVKTFDEIDTPLLARFQDRCLAKGMKPITVNHYVCYLSNILNHLLVRGRIEANPCKNLDALVKTGEKATGCYETNALKGVFNKRWTNRLSYLLNLLIYTTDMRNIEIEKIRLKDFFMMGKYRFLDIPESKTENGVRIVPIHDFVYRKITLFARGNKLEPEDFIFKLPRRKRLGSDTYKKAYTELAKHIGYDEDRVKKENIRFYSGRHFWKTIMNGEGLGDIEEYFMGHKVTGDVAKRYNHKDKQGRRNLLDKTRKVFQILDRRVFA